MPHRFSSIDVTLLTVASLSALAGATHAQVGWATWNAATSNSVSGTITVGSELIAVNYSGEVLVGQTQLNGVGTNHFLPVATYTGPGVPNAPPGGTLIGIIGGTTRIDTVTFSRPIVDPLVALWSVGAPGSPITYNFNATPTLVSGGPNAQFGGSSISILPGNIVRGAEGNGIVRFSGTYTSLSWTVPTGENYHGFTVGVTGVAPAASSAAPEPGTIALLLTAGVPAAYLVRRRKASRPHTTFSIPVILSQRHFP